VEQSTFISTVLISLNCFSIFLLNCDRYFPRPSSPGSSRKASYPDGNSIYSEDDHDADQVDIVIEGGDHGGAEWVLGVWGQVRNEKNKKNKKKQGQRYTTRANFNILLLQ
jgi:hypothetical protein